MTHTTVPVPRKPLRLWPGVAAAGLILLSAVVQPLLIPVGVLVGLLWWLFFSRAAWAERLGALAMMLAAVFATRPFLHASITGAGMGFLFFFFAAATMTLALVLWAATTRRLAGPWRLVTMAAAVAIGCALWTVVRTGGLSGDGDMDLHWRWTPTPEERLIAQARDERLAPPANPPAPANETKAVAADAVDTRAAETRPAESTAIAPAAAADPVPPRTADWPGFRGHDRDGVVRSVRFETDWARTPPSELWRAPVGPGWSSFAVDGDLFYTQEQRGEHEVVSCYRLSTGEPVWRHRDPIRFYESNAGAGPRGTPTLHDGRVYTLGATGILNALDAKTGARFWSRRTAADADKKIPDWGIASSPLVVDNLVIVAVAGRLAAYDIATGRPQWMGEQGGGGYSSPHLATLDGVRQVLLVRGSRTISVSPSDGQMLWEHNWAKAVSIVQPLVIGERDVLIASHDGMSGNGLRRLEVKRGSSGWTVEERWTSRGLKPYFSDTVVHKGHAYGFDGTILSCIDLATGERKWKGGRYGAGQMLLIADEDVLLITAEEGDIALVKASPDQYTELSRIEAIKGKTWNHPVVVREVLLMRNAEEMAAFRLPRRSTN